MSSDSDYKPDDTQLVVSDIHNVSFALNQRTGLWRAVCSCGWSWISGDRDRLNTRAANHDFGELK